MANVDDGGDRNDMIDEEACRKDMTDDETKDPCLSCRLMDFPADEDGLGW